MTTKVRIEMLEDHTPVVVEVINKLPDGKERLRHYSMLSQAGASTEEYIHSGQTLRIRELTTAEAHNGSIASV